jgi:hypothetical protein
VEKAFLMIFWGLGGSAKECEGTHFDKKNLKIEKREYDYKYGNRGHER